MAGAEAVRGSPHRGEGPEYEGAGLPVVSGQHPAGRGGGAGAAVPLLQGPGGAGALPGVWENDRPDGGSGQPLAFDWERYRRP